MFRILVTGANGFVGRVLCPMLAEAGYAPRVALRVDKPIPAGAVERVIVDDIDSDTCWAAAVTGVDAVIHLAARVHVLGSESDDEHLYLETNAYGTRRLAEQAAQHGVRRLVYLSSVKVNGEATTGRAYSAADVPQPLDAYGYSKWHGERLLAQTAAGTGMQAVVVRSPLVYGPGVRANFLRLLRWVDRGWPLPFGAVSNRRSLVSVWNLCDLLIRVLSHPAASGRVWMVSDDQDLSTAELIRNIGAAMGRPVKLPSVPLLLLRAFAALLGRRAEFERLCGSLCVDIGPTRDELGWAPPVSVAEGLARTVRWYTNEYRGMRGNP